MAIQAKCPRLLHVGSEEYKYLQILSILSINIVFTSPFVPYPTINTNFILQQITIIQNFNMRSNTLITALALTSVVVAAPVPNDPVSDMFTKISDLIGSPFGNGNGNGNGNTAGVGNDGNVSLQPSPLCFLCCLFLVA